MSLIAASIAGTMGSIGSMLSTMHKAPVKAKNAFSYAGVGGRAFTRGKRSKSLKVRANRRKAKSKARGKK